MCEEPIKPSWTIWYKILVLPKIYHNNSELMSKVHYEPDLSRLGPNFLEPPEPTSANPNVLP